jgi:hypothetical protein
MVDGKGQWTPNTQTTIKLTTTMATGNNTKYNNQINDNHAQADGHQNQHNNRMNNDGAGRWARIPTIQQSNKQRPWQRH